MDKKFKKLVPEEGKPARSKKIIIFPVVLLSLVIFLIFGLVIPLNLLYTRYQDTVLAVKDLGAALKNQNIEETAQKIPEAGKKLDSLESTLKILSWAGLVPFVNNYYNDVLHGLNAGKAGLKALDISVQAISPYADLLGLKGKGSFTGGTADDRIQTVVKTFDKITPKLADISAWVEKADSEVSAIDPSRYPENFRGKPVRSQLINLRSALQETALLFVSARPLLENLPKIMGEPSEKKYLVLFQNDKELRPTGGFITAYAVFRLEHGKIVIDSSDDIYKLDDTRTKKVGAPPEILKYHSKVYYFNLRDSNLSPDFAESVKLFNSLYESSKEKKKIDGIITVDTHVLVSALNILGPVEAAGIKFTSETDKRCDCPQVIYELEEFADRPIGHVRSGRKDIIGQLLYEIMKKSLGLSPGKYWGSLFQMGVNEFNEKHILANLYDPQSQSALEALNWAGRIKDYQGDYLHINDTNFAGAKTNMFTNHFIKQEISIDVSGRVSKTLTLDYKNPYPPSNCNLESGGLCLNGLLRNWVRIYTPKGSRLISFTGSQTEPVVKDELGKTVFEGFHTVAPQGTAQLVVKYELPSTVKNQEYDLLLQKQPGTAGHEYTIIINGRQKEKFNLTADREIKLKF